MSGPRDELMGELAAERATERRNPRSQGLHAMATGEALDVFQAEDEHMLRAVGAERERVAAAVELIAERLARGGRLFYVGAGTSGRLGVLDAAECPPTFQTDPEQVQGILAGGPAALAGAVEGAEDSAADGARRVGERGVGARDVVFGITAGGGTPFVHGALERARALGAATVFLACVPAAEAPASADVEIRPLVGPEVLAGSTRLKGGTATKLVLNRVSTLVMARLGHVHGNLMVDLDTRANAKLAARGAALVAELTGLPRPASAALLEAAGGRVKVAALMHAAGCDRASAEERLRAAGGHLGPALASSSARARTSDA